MVELLSDTAWRWRYLKQAIEAGAVFGYATDTIWGIGCHPWVGEAVERVLRVKQRPKDKGLILLGTQALQFNGLLEDDDLHHLQELPQSDRPTTWLVPPAHSCPAWLRGKHPTLAIRLTRQPLIRKLCEPLGCALVSTSANRSGQQPARSARLLHKQLGADLDFILDSPVPGTGQASRIIELQSGRVIRP